MPFDFSNIKAKGKLNGLSFYSSVSDNDSVHEIPLDLIDSFEGHPFSIVDNDYMVQLAESVKHNGIMNPAIVREKGSGRYELISGHRRKRACELAGLKTLKAYVKQLTDEEATIIMVDSNLQREKILPSERAFAYKMKLEAMKRQGVRTDLTLSQNETKSRSDEVLSKQVGESRAQVQRYIRLTELIPELLDLVDSKKLKFTVAVDISYIDKEIQKWIYEYIKDTGFIKPQQITALRNQLNEGAVNQVGMLTIFNKCMMVKTPSRSITFSEKKLTKYFPESYSADDMERVIESLLEKWSQGQNN